MRNDYSALETTQQKSKCKWFHVNVNGFMWLSCSAILLECTARNKDRVKGVCTRKNQEAQARKRWAWYRSSQKSHFPWLHGYDPREDTPEMQEKQKKQGWGTCGGVTCVWLLHSMLHNCGGHTDFRQQLPQLFHRTWTMSVSAGDKCNHWDERYKKKSGRRWRRDSGERYIVPDDTVLTNASGVGTVIEGVQSREKILWKFGTGSSLGSAAKSWSNMSAIPPDTEAGLRTEG